MASAVEYLRQLGSANIREDLRRRSLAVIPGNPDRIGYWRDCDNVSNDPIYDYYCLTGMDSLCICSRNTFRSLSVCWVPRSQLRFQFSCPSMRHQSPSLANSEVVDRILPIRR